MWNLICISPELSMWDLFSSNNHVVITFSFLKNFKQKQSACCSSSAKYTTSLWCKSWPPYHSDCKLWDPTLMLVHVEKEHHSNYKPWFPPPPKFNNGFSLYVILVPFSSALFLSVSVVDFEQVHLCWVRRVSTTHLTFIPEVYL